MQCSQRAFGSNINCKHYKLNNNEMIEMMEEMIEMMEEMMKMMEETMEMMEEFDENDGRFCNYY